MTKKDMMVKRLIAIAEHEIGYHEKETNLGLDTPNKNNGDKNFTKYARDLALAGYYQANKNGYDWCDVFVDWCFLILCGSRKVAEKITCQSGPYGAGCGCSADYYRWQGQLFDTPQAGDQVFFGDYAHTGIVVEVSKDKVCTIEGNTSNQVARREYAIDDYRLTSFGRPKFDLIPDNVFPFVDVPYDAWSREAIAWGVGASITNGVDELHFAPSENCNRADIVTMIWRSQGHPRAKGTENFADAKDDAYYKDAVLWAKGEGITKGIGNNLFDPYGDCTRSQVVTMLWRLCGSPIHAHKVPFLDVPMDQFYSNAVAWACDTGLTNGFNEMEFRPDSPCTREQMMKFLYKFYENREEII